MAPTENSHLHQLSKLGAIYHEKDWVNGTRCSGQTSATYGSPPGEGQSSLPSLNVMTFFLEICFLIHSWLYFAKVGGTAKANIRVGGTERVLAVPIGGGGKCKGSRCLREALATPVANPPPAALFSYREEAPRTEWQLVLVFTRGPVT